MLHFYLTLLSVRSNHPFLLRGCFLKGAKELILQPKKTLHWKRPREKYITLKANFVLALMPGNGVAETEVNTLLELVISLSTSPLTRRQKAWGKSLAGVAKLGEDFLPQQNEPIFTIITWSFLISLWTSILQLSFSPMAWSSVGVMWVFFLSFLCLRMPTDSHTEVHQPVRME